MADDPQLDGIQGKEKVFQSIDAQNSSSESVRNHLTPIDLQQVLSSYGLQLIGLCAFIFCLGFKPSEPYLSQFLICNKSTQLDYCSAYSQDECNYNAPCLWSMSSCSVSPCSNVSIGSCGNDDYDYCYKSSGRCVESTCYKRFSQNEVNNDIYPWSTYAYFPFLILLGPYAEMVSYRIAIIFGILGRVATRFLLIYGNTLTEMQIMQVTYAMGTAAEDVFSAYVYYAVPLQHYTSATSYVKASAFVASLLSGFLGDILVVLFNYSIDTLMVISAVFVCIGVFIGLFVISAVSESSTKSTKLTMADKVRIMKRQLYYIVGIFDNKETFYLVLCWLFGNAVFTVRHG
jgi:hypothetical protein